MIRRVVNSIFSYILSYSGEKIIKVIGYFFLIIYNLVRFIKHNFLFSTGPLFEKNGLIVFQKSPDFVPPEQRSKNYVFIDFLFNLVTKFLCSHKLKQFKVKIVIIICQTSNQSSTMEDNYCSSKSIF